MKFYEFGRTNMDKRSIFAVWTHEELFLNGKLWRGERYF